MKTSIDNAPRPITVLISAIGGEGGGVLMNWLVNAAIAQGLPVQSTSVPGVAQRTGATTYYIELFPLPFSELDGREPILSLYPGVGDVDLVVASELIEVGRMMERGFVNPDRTLLIGSTHRAYAIAEKMVGWDGRYDSSRVLNAASKMAKQAILFDVEDVARECGCVGNAVLLGAIAGSGRLPLPPSALEDAVRAEGKAVEANLAGFARGLAYGRGEKIDLPSRDKGAATGGRPSKVQKVDRKKEALVERVRDYPEATRAIISQAISRLIDYQNTNYARLYLDRLDSILAVDSNGKDSASLTSVTCRYLASWMSYEDVMRVAQLKTRRGRFEQVRTDVGAKPEQIVKLTDFLKPGLEELCSVLPPFVARPILRWAARRHLMGRLHIDMQVKTSTVGGFLSLWILTKLIPLRRFGYRFKEEQTMIEDWLSLVTRTVALNQHLAMEVATCACLIRGYGDTHKRGVGHFLRIVKEVIEPALAGDIAPVTAIEAVANAREAAMTNPEATSVNEDLTATAKVGQAQVSP